MDRSARRLLLAALLLAAAPLAGQQAESAAHRRVAGCYALEPSAEAPWLGELYATLRLTLEPLEAEPGAGPQYRVRPAAASASAAPAFPFQAWSLYGGDLVAIVWSSERDMIDLTFVPELDRTRTALGTTTHFRHELMKASPPVDVRVSAVDC